MKRRINNIIKKSVILSHLKLILFKRRWRKRNAHNFTTAKVCFDIKKVEVGKGTYGELDVRHFGNPEERLVIGNYCSIAPECVFLLGGQHNYKSISTFPFGAKYGFVENESLVKGRVIVEDDVWIGFRSIIMSGVTLGRGCVVAAGAVVTKDVPPYSIVGGCPARVIKYRFEKPIIEKLSKLNFDNLSEEIIKRNINEISANVDEIDMDELIMKINCK